MVLIDVEDLVLQRIGDIKKADPELLIDYDIEKGEEGLWGVIAVVDADEPIAFEFIESDNSWKRPSALEEYNELSEEGFDVAVIVPDEAFTQVAEILSCSGQPEIVVYSYTSLELIPRPLAS